MNNYVVYFMIVILMIRFVGFIMRVLKGDPLSTVIVDFNGLMDLDLQIILCTVRVVFESMNTLKFALLLTSGSVLAQWSHVMNTQLSVVSWTLKEVCIPLVQYRLVVEMLTTK
ncbi:hypothetical protein FRACYDRAFT_254123 [Fragilariopsis cylindrus CCMP1102]|uniref:Uncharacterized protein n=1 Tax=Fragilariopsis cylindrus CCMP1102 TaxID=635003 RepID=A0A1E7ELD8_9STRA|nr:hypothetical protein FRACYDRAFT_254123 [Fragilariopsis cylindrus CCMP1102]|eukprot:OEU06685.1 hypothetical protein FRACYDRAFT_254123 [Fragilariopsis cylindrus CCMP1102]